MSMDLYVAVTPEYADPPQPLKALLSNDAKIQESMPPGIMRKCDRNRNTHRKVSEKVLAGFH